MAHDDWRVRVELPSEGGGFLDRLGLLAPAAEELAEELRDRRLAATREGDTVFVYAESAAQAERVRALVESELRAERIGVDALDLERWLADEERWSNEPPGPTAEEEILARGYAPWEVRVECSSAREARDVADRLREEGYGVVRTWRYVFAGTETREEAEALARRVHGEAEPGGEMVWEVMPGKIFAIFA